MTDINNEVMNNEVNAVNEVEVVPETPNAIIPDVIEETAIIASDTKIVGNIKTKGHVAIEGFVEGDVTASGNVIVTGSVRGNISADNIIVAGGQLIANLYAKHQVSIKAEAVVNGDIEGEDISLAGMVNGDTHAKGNVILASTGRITGNINCANIGVEVGARFNGLISME